MKETIVLDVKDKKAFEAVYDIMMRSQLLHGAKIIAIAEGDYIAKLDDVVALLSHSEISDRLFSIIAEVPPKGE